MAIGNPTKPLQGCTCEGAHEHLTLNGIRSSRDDHLSIEFREMISRVLCPYEKGNLRSDVMRWYNLLQDFLREWSEIVS